MILPINRLTHWTCVVVPRYQLQGRAAFRERLLAERFMNLKRVDGLYVAKTDTGMRHHWLAIIRP